MEPTYGVVCPVTSPQWMLLGKWLGHNWEAVLDLFRLQARPIIRRWSIWVDALMFGKENLCGRLMNREPLSLPKVWSSNAWNTLMAGIVVKMGMNP